MRMTAAVPLGSQQWAVVGASVFMHERSATKFLKHASVSNSMEAHHTTHNDMLRFLA